MALQVPLLPNKEQRWARTISLWVLGLDVEAKVGGTGGSTSAIISKDVFGLHHYNVGILHTRS
jgi:hypothetical protein